MTSLSSSRREMAKAYNPREVEDRLYIFWEQGGYFMPKLDSGKKPFCIIMPPPNVTGELHLGHALVATISDFLVRWHRMKGEPTLWLPGEDHASIAAQWVMEQELARGGVTRQQIGREKFLERMWEWMDKYRHIIMDQHKMLGTSCDWTRERFTMDPGPSQAVANTFVNYHDQGLIYRGYRIINWCPRCGTALSDLEVDHEERGGALYYVHYRLADGSGRITVATTRPETIPGDTAVAVNPEDPRFKQFIGKRVVLPIIGREIPVIADEAVDTSFGTGALKITPAHDPVDFEVGQRHNLPTVLAMNLDGTMNAEAGPYNGMTREDCREAILKDLEAQGLLDRIDPSYAHTVGQCYRCRTIVEPIVSEQWFLDVQDMAAKAIAAVQEGRINILPDRFAKVYFNWMENIRDWCISRQLWWGHRIPAWYCAACDGDAITVQFLTEVNDAQGRPRLRDVYNDLIAAGISHEVIVEQSDRLNIGMKARPMVGLEAPSRCPQCGGTQLIQDSDVLDTWFSSGLWPHSTLGWPEKTEDLRTFYPTSVMVTAYDILFFWVARMIMMGIQNTGEAPFRTVYLHGLIRDGEGEKMSKSKGNVISPVDTIAAYGTDALRFTLATGSTPGNDMRLSDQRLEASRNFANKLWNAARFVMSNLPQDRLTEPAEALDRSRPTEDRWIVSRLHRLMAQQDDLLQNFQFGEAGRYLYEFLWNEFCDWYIEIAKIRLRSPQATRRGESGDALRQAQDKASPLPVLAYVLEQSLRLLHPVMPYITEEIWQSLKPMLQWQEDAPSGLIIAQYPQADPSRYDEAAEAEMTGAIDVIRAIRNARSERNVAPSRLIQAQVFSRSNVESGLRRQAEHIKALARLESISFASDAAARPAQAVPVVLTDCEVYLPLLGLLDLDVERERLSKELAQAQDEKQQVGQKLANQDFVSRAPAAVVEKERARLAAAQERIDRLEAMLRELRG